MHPKAHIVKLSALSSVYICLAVACVTTYFLNAVMMNEAIWNKFGSFLFILDVFVLLFSIVRAFKYRRNEFDIYSAAAAAISAAWPAHHILSR